MAAALLNLSGLGLGYVLMRRWFAVVVCWLAIGVLLVIALPADANGVPGGVLVASVILLAIEVAHGAVRGLRTALVWPRRSSLAAVLAVVMLAVPVGGVMLYDRAHDEAVERMLLGRLDQADRVVAAAEGDPLSIAEPQYGTALAAYRDLLVDDRGSRAAKLVPGRLAAFYQTIAAPYARRDYCDAIEPLTYLRTIPGTFGAGNLKALASWPDDRLATSLFQCGVSGLGTGDDSSATTVLGQLLTVFPKSPQAAKVEPAVASAINAAAGGIGGKDPCAATATLRTLATQAAALPVASKDAATANNGVESGTYACGVSQYKDGRFSDAQTTMDDFVSAYPHDPNLGLARKFSIAAQIAQQDPAAGKTVPTLASGGSVTLTILNDSPDAAEILYTGTATGSVTIGACGSCPVYPSEQMGQQFSCTDNTDYPQATVTLPPGTTYFLHEDTGDQGIAGHTFSERFDAGSAHVLCAYVTSGSITNAL